MAEGRAQVWLGATRPRTLPAAVAPVLVGTAFAWRGGAFSAGAAGLCLTFALLVQIGANFANDYYDFVHGADTPGRVGPRRAVAAGLISPATMKRAMWGVFTVAFLSGLGLVAWGGPWLIAVGVISILCGIAYTGGPWPLGYHGLGDVFVFVFFGLVAVGATFYVQAGLITSDVLLAGAAIGALTTNILLLNNYRDLETDVRANKRTLVVRFGRGFARAQFGGAMAFAWLVPVALWARGAAAWILLPFLLAPVAMWHLRRLSAARESRELIALLGETGLLLAGYAVLLSIGVML
ncbi:1,4-dihydroxy-2-naphthoate polyprenyltransferase [Horticoccus luteus]|uniref:1,4-dihydroxy-2-naphthoate octaprenyltransferase n=1 Tax=Horticoccus luteus TaxID=2862869 RepID=A0A8F9XHU6_9BACT|nr:1,4-dihydroxy-2-naphthoate polyprenyltransferase [Horticoccus luteus]QYM80632.1 1,4-dihydroxy-2-naphthoate polyprenyltransferase [Horticoccus luteus]